MKSNEIDEMLHRIREELAAEYKPRTDEEMEAEAREFARACGLELEPNAAPKRGD